MKTVAIPLRQQVLMRLSRRVECGWCNFYKCLFLGGRFHGTRKWRNGHQKTLASRYVRKYELSLCLH